MERMCKNCGKHFEAKQSHNVYCSTECRLSFNSKKAKLNNYKINPERKGLGKGGGQNKGKESPYYKHGETLYREIKKLSMEELKCEKCGSLKNLHVHHIDEDRYNNDIENLIMLCKPCHKKEHMGGDKNYFSRLTSEEVVFIYENPLNLSKRELCFIFDCHVGLISKIHNRKTWHNTTENLKKNIVDKIVNNIYLVNDNTYITSLEELKIYIGYPNHKIIARNIKDNKLTKGYKILRITKEDYIKVLKNKKDEYFKGELK